MSGLEGTLPVGAGGWVVGFGVLGGVGEGGVLVEGFESFNEVDFAFHDGIGIFVGEWDDFLDGVAVEVFAAEEGLDEVKSYGSAGGHGEVSLWLRVR